MAEMKRLTINDYLDTLEQFLGSGSSGATRKKHNARAVTKGFTNSEVRGLRAIASKSFESYDDHANLAIVEIYRLFRDHYIEGSLNLNSVRRAAAEDPRVTRIFNDPNNRIKTIDPRNSLFRNQEDIVPEMRQIVTDSWNAMVPSEKNEETFKKLNEEKRTTGVQGIEEPSIEVNVSFAKRLRDKIDSLEIKIRQAGEEDVELAVILAQLTLALKDYI